MPTYVYECAKCGEELEVWQSFSDDPLKRHTGSCRGKLVKVIQPAGIVLKGSGFYKNDSGSRSKRPTGDRGSDSGDKGSGDKGSGEKSSETKSSDTKASKPDAGSKSDGPSSSGNGSSSSPSKSPASSTSG